MTESHVEKLLQQMSREEPPMALDRRIDKLLQSGSERVAPIGSVNSTGVSWSALIASVAIFAVCGAALGYGIRGLQQKGQRVSDTETQLSPNANEEASNIGQDFLLVGNAPPVTQMCGFSADQPANSRLECGKCHAGIDAAGEEHESIHDIAAIVRALQAPIGADGVHGKMCSRCHTNLPKDWAKPFMNANFGTPQQPI